MNNIFEEFTNQYQLSKTLRFELKPVFSSNLSEVEQSAALNRYWDEYLCSDLYKHDKARKESYPIVKNLIDIFHKRFIKESLSTFKCNKWDKLYNIYISAPTSKEYKNLQKEIRKEIEDNFKKQDWWKYAQSYSQLIKNFEELLQNNDDFYTEISKNKEIGHISEDEIKNHLNVFNGFATFFETLQKNRNNMYSSEAKETSIANRIVNENFVIFVNNIKIYKHLQDNCQSRLNEIEKKLSIYLAGLNFNDVFSPSFYNECLTQEGIERYNLVIGGDPAQDLTGINSIGNEFLQQNPASNMHLRDLKMVKLHKQILSERERYALIPEQFDNGKKGEIQLIEAIDSYINGTKPLFIKAHEIFKEISSGENVDTKHIYIEGRHINALSQMLYWSWNKLAEALGQNKLKQSTNNNTYVDSSKWAKNKVYSLAQIIQAEKDNQLTCEKNKGIKDFLEKLEVIEKCNTANSTLFEPIKKAVRNKDYILESQQTKETIKAILDNYMDCLRTLEIFRINDSKKEKDEIYEDYDSLFESEDENVATLSDIVPLYNKVRNYVTRKFSGNNVTLLKYDCPTLADGWDQNKETSNNAALLFDNDNYYLLLLNSQKKPNLSEAITGKKGYRKLVYHQIGNVAADIPNLMVIDGETVKKIGHSQNGVNKELEDLKNKYLPEDINRIRKSASYKASSNTFNKTDSQNYIRYYMQRIIEYKKGDINFHFKTPEEYDSYENFIDDVKHQKFSISFVDFDKEIVNKWIDNGQVFLFQIFNKDFSEKSHGTDNMHTLYWKEIFCQRNLENVVFQLNGKCKLFYRDIIVKSPYTHKRQSKLVNKTYSDGMPIPQEDYMAFHKYYNEEGIKLNDIQEKNLQRVQVKDAKFDIIKDKRYSERKLFFHIPITINFKSKEIDSNKVKAFNKDFNLSTLEILRKHKDDINIIGIDRGERNLIYVSVIDKYGNILKDEKGNPLIKNFNIIEAKTYDNFVRKYDYLEKLKQVEGDRNRARKNWDIINNIKELKSGYLALVVHEIAQLVVKYNAIIVLENLNQGFKRGRFNVERQVYQKFEEALIKKLNYLVFKSNSPSNKYGNVNNGLQLTAPYTSFKDLGKQSGWLFYVPAEYTSKIDPQTGFVNLFNMKKAEKNPKNFFSAFESIEYKNNHFYFKFNYSNPNIATIKPDSQNIWTLVSYGNRIKSIKDEETNRIKQTEVCLNQEFESVFNNKETNIPLNEISKKRIINDPNANMICKKLFNAFKLLLQMRNSISNSSTDYLISPTESTHPFDTRQKNEYGIKDADANGAYHIALKGLYLLYNDFPTNKDEIITIGTSQWLDFIQKKPYRKKEHD